MPKVDDQSKSQAEKFADLARELERDDDEAAFDERLRKLATTKPRRKGTWDVHPAKVGNGYIPWFTPDDPYYDQKTEGPNFNTKAEAEAWAKENW